MSFFRRIRRSFSTNGLGKFLVDVSTLGLGDKRQMIQNSRSVGVMRKDYSSYVYNSDYDDYEFLGLVNDANNRYIPRMDSSYVDRRGYLRSMSKETDIEYILTILTDECIVYDDNNFFCYPNKVSTDYKKHDVLDKNIQSNFQDIYRKFNFDNNTTAWWYMYKFLVDGFLAFEIIYDNPKKPRKIIGFKNLDPVSLTLGTDKQGNQIWIEYEGDAINERILLDSQVIYISYASSSFDGRTSYIERLIKPYNLLRTTEQTRLSWSVINASYRLKFIIPSGAKSKTQAQQSLAKMMNEYNEEISFDHTSGEFRVNGKPYQPGVRQWWFPEKDGSSPTIETVGNDGAEVNDVEMIQYFARKFYKTSLIPASRFEDDGSTLFNGTDSQITQEEKRFNRFVMRLRTVFKTLLEKPLYIQTLLDNKEFRRDPAFKSQISLYYNSYNLFEELKNMEIEERKIDHVERLYSLERPNGDPYFTLDHLFRKYKLFTDEDLERNEDSVDKEEKDGFRDDGVDDF